MTIAERLAAHAAWLADGCPDDDPRRLVEHGDALAGAILRHADLSGAIRRGADLHGADLSVADLRGASLRGADLSVADLRGASLRGADMRRAIPFGASLCGASLCGVNLRSVNLRGADMSGAHGIVSAGPVGRERRIIYAVDHSDRVMIQAGCRWDTADAVVVAIEADYAEKPAMRDAYVATVRAMVAALEAAR